MTVVSLVLVLMVAMLLREVLYRLFIIYPHTSVRGHYAAHIEEEDIYRWLAPVVAGHQGKFDVFFVGNSHVMDGIDPGIVAAHSGLRCYNVAVYSLASLHGMDLISRYGNYPRVAVIDFSTRYALYRRSTEVVTRAERCLDTNVWSRRWLQVIDHVHCIAPSFFVPNPYRGHLLRRAMEKTRLLAQTGRMAVGRYTPFRPFVDYDWRLDKTTNHRHAVRVRRSTRWQASSEEYYLHKCIAETGVMCPIGSVEYNRSFRETSSKVELYLRNGVSVIFMRMPMDPRMIAHENAVSAQYFDDVRTLARKHKLPYLDLNAGDHARRIGVLEFYADGQHVLQSGAKTISEYLAAILRNHVAELERSRAA